MAFNSLQKLPHSLAKKVRAPGLFGLPCKGSQLGRQCVMFRS
jgi:hypothetical protein